jgi:hypothetical protein
MQLLLHQRFTAIYIYIYIWNSCQTQDNHIPWRWQLQFLPKRYQNYATYSRNPNCTQTIVNWRPCSAEAVSRRLPTRRPGFDPRWGRVGFVVDEVALRQVFLRVLRFSLPIVILPTAPRSSSGAGTIGQIVAEVPSGLSLTALQETRKKKKFCCPSVAGNSFVPEAFPNLSFYALCGLVFRVPGYRSRGPGSILGAVRVSEK